MLSHLSFKEKLQQEFSTYLFMTFFLSEQVVPTCSPFIEEAEERPSSCKTIQPCNPEDEEKR